MKIKINGRTINIDDLDKEALIHLKDVLDDEIHDISERLDGPVSSDVGYASWRTSAVSVKQLKTEQLRRVTKRLMFLDALDRIGGTR